MLKRQSFHQSTANVRTFLGMVLVFSIFQSHKYHKLLPQHLSSAIQPPVAPQATHGKRHLCANIGDLILLKAQHLQGPVAAKSLCKRLRKRNLGNSSASISACDNVCVCQTKPIVNIPVKQNREIPTPFGSLWYELDVLSSSCFPCCRTSECVVAVVASQCNARYDETEPLRPAPYPRSFEPTPSSHKPGLRRQKCRCCPSRCSSRSSPDCHSSTVGRPPGFAQKTATSNQGGSQHLTLSRIFNRSYRSPKQRQQLHPSHLGKITKTP